jgi:hypothetical protein
MVYRKSTNSGPQAVIFLVLSFHSFEEMFLRNNLEKHLLQCQNPDVFFQQKICHFWENPKNLKRKSHCSNMELTKIKIQAFKTQLLQL